MTQGATLVNPRYQRKGPALFTNVNAWIPSELCEDCVNHFRSLLQKRQMTCNEKGQTEENDPSQNIFPWSKHGGKHSLLQLLTQWRAVVTVYVASNNKTPKQSIYELNSVGLSHDQLEGVASL